jgi:regulator of protease activity HflC (stomatin/prohibitin superfamily)
VATGTKVLDKFIELIREWIELFYIFEVIHPYERAVKLRKGLFVEVLEPGWHWYWPCKFEQIITHAVAPDPTALRVQSLTTADGVRVNVRGVLNYEVFDVKQLVLGVTDAMGGLVDSAMGTIAFHVTGAKWEDLRTPEFLRKVEIEIRRRAKKYGIDVIELQWQDLSRTSSMRIWSA